MAVPAGEPNITAQLPLLKRVWNDVNQAFEYNSIGGALTTTLPAGASTSWTLVPDRSAMSGTVGDLYAGILRISDSGDHGSYSDLTLPISAEIGSLSGLWVGDAVITEIQNQLDAPPNTTTPTAQSFPLRLIIHIDDDQTARLLSNLYYGILDTDPPSLGCATFLFLFSHPARRRRCVSPDRNSGTRCPCR